MTPFRRMPECVPSLSSSEGGEKPELPFLAKQFPRDPLERDGLAALGKIAPEQKTHSHACEDDK